MADLKCRCGSGRQTSDSHPSGHGVRAARRVARRVRSEPQDESDRCPREIERPPPLDAVADIEIQVAEGAEIPEVAAEADVRPDEEHRSSTKAPGTFAALETHDVIVDIGADDAE